MTFQKLSQSYFCQLKFKLKQIFIIQLSIFPLDVPFVYTVALMHILFNIKLK